jgi:hypothetical protein
MKYVPPWGTSDPDAVYINGNPSTGTEGSIPPADAFNEPLRELHNLVLYNGITPDDVNLDQVTRATRRQFTNFAIDTGSTNALSISLQPPPTGYNQGTPIRVLVANTNTGACTINNSGMGIRAIKRPDGADLVAGDIRAGGVAYLIDDGTHYQLVNYLSAPAGPPTQITTKIPYCGDSSTTVNLILANYSPAITSLVEGDFLAVKIANTNTGPVTMTTNAMPNYPMYRNDAKPLVARDLLKNEAILLEFHGTYYQVIGPVASQYRLTVDLTLYVRTDGNDLNDGSANDAAHAFRTIMGCLAYIQQSFAIAGRTVTIQLGNAGTYDTVSITAMNTGNLILRGDPANMDSYVIPNSAGHNACLAISASNVSVAGVTFNQPGNFASAWMVATNGAQVSLTNVSFTGFQQTPDLQDIGVFRGAEVQLFGTIKTQGNKAGFIGSQGGNATAGGWSCLIQVNGGPTYSNGFAYGGYGGVTTLTYGWTTFSGAAAGKRYALVYNAIINTAGGGASGGPSYLPGNLPGVANTGSWYI